MDSFTVLKRLKLPPNTVKIDTNLFADKTEIANIDYREYLFWLKKIYGYKSHRYQAALPDTLVWEYNEYEPFYLTYFVHPAYDMCPLVGVSYEQAVGYSDWRTNVVYELLLIKKKKIKAYPQDSTNFFSVERYLSGQYNGVTPDKTIPIPRFRLPTETEWIKLSGGEFKKPELGYYGVSIPKKYRKKGYKIAYWGVFDTKEFRDMLVGSNSIPNPVRVLFKNKWGIYNTIGNVAEMTATKGLAKGGSYQHSLQDCGIDKQILYTIPNCWLGFRNVCSWEFPKID